MENVTPAQLSLLNELKRDDPDLAFEWNETSGIASFVRGKLYGSEPRDAKPEILIRRFLSKFGELFGPSNISEDLTLLRTLNDDLGWSHLEFQQVYSLNQSGEAQTQRVEIYGSKLAAHFTDDLTLVEVQSSCWREIVLENGFRILAKELQDIMLKSISGIQDFRRLEQSMFKQQEKTFPIMQEPVLVVYPWLLGFRLAWSTYAYGAIGVKDSAGRSTDIKKIEFGHVFIDAFTGEQFLFEPTTMYAETPDTGVGLGVTPLGGPFVTRTLNIVSVDTPPIYRLKDTTHARDIIIYDAAANSSWSTADQIAGSLSDSSIPVSDDTDKNWNRKPKTSFDSERTLSQQPEVDAYFFAKAAYEWYDAIAGGRAGWDDGRFPNPPVPHQPVRIVTHVVDHGLKDDVVCTPTSRSINGFSSQILVDKKWISFVALFDGDPTATCSSANDRAFDYVAGSKNFVGHEYQHRMTDFSFINGLDHGLGNDDGWKGAVHEGLSDVFGCLFAENWFLGRDVSSTGLCIRNLAFPRDPNSWVNSSFTKCTPCGKRNHNKDHFDDRNLDSSFKYDRGTILAHCAYLMEGGVHQRASRLPVLIPVQSIGRAVVNSKDILKASRIWYRALTFYLSNIGTTTGLPASDENMFHNIRNACVNASIDLYSMKSLEHRTTILAFYAVGLQSVSTLYGADVTFLTWGADWWTSMPYIGLSSPAWSSLDLFINNGGTSEWNALINITDSSGIPTQFENNVYCRVRNIGDQSATNIQVRFYYAKAGTGITTWLPVTDKNGTVQVLSPGSLSAGQSNFPDSAQNSPPSSAGIKWFIPQLAAGETVDHFCLKAEVTSSNDVNIHNNQVQSNIAYTPYTPLGFSMAFNVGNPSGENVPLELHVTSSLPKGWKVNIKESIEGLQLKPGEEKTLNLVLDMPAEADKQLEPPFEGDIMGEVYGTLCGPFSGFLNNVNIDNQNVEGFISGRIKELGTIIGNFRGHMNPPIAEIDGTVEGTFHCVGKVDTERICIGIKACLRPFRRIDISQVHKGENIGGITIQVQVPIPGKSCEISLPPTNTYILKQK